VFCSYKKRLGRSVLGVHKAGAGEEKNNRKEK